MKIKIMSMQRVVNYGSFMQAYALMQTIRKLGHEVEFVDFRAGTPRHKGEKVKPVRRIEKLRRLPHVLCNLPTYLKKRKFRRDFEAVYKASVTALLGLPEDACYDYACDVFVIGSDEVFNYTQNHAHAYVPALFGNDVDSPWIMSYAASAGYASVADVESDGMREELAAGFARFRRISVRDENTLELVRHCTGEDPVLVVDPTLIYEFDSEIGPPLLNEPYMIVYAYDGRLDSPEEIASVRGIAEPEGLRTVSVGFFHDWCDENRVVTPFELLSLFRHAKYVVTDTFHGTIFSIKNRRPFVSLLRGENRWGSNSNKLGFLLRQLGLEHRVNRDLAQLAQQLRTPVDYDQVFSRIADLKAPSLAFLETSLSDAAKELNK